MLLPSLQINSPLLSLSVGLLVLFLMSVVSSIELKSVWVFLLTVQSACCHVGLLTELLLSLTELLLSLTELLLSLTEMLIVLGCSLD